jgi:DNA-binding NarL/FixJ family response regulator
MDRYGSDEDGPIGRDLTAVGRLSSNHNSPGLKAARALNSLRVIIADDLALFRQGLCSLLVLEVLQVVAEVERTGSNLVATLEAHSCDVLLLDVKMERSSMDQILDLSRMTSVVALVTENESTDLGLTALRRGARAVVHKRLPLETLMTAIHAVANGLVWVPPAILQAALTEPDNAAAKKLTLRESEIVRNVAIGMRNAEVAARLSLSESTVKSHLARIFQKLGIRDRIELTRYAIRTELTSLQSR